MSTRRQVISVIVYGDAEEGNLRKLAEQVREDLLAKPEITLAELSGVRPLEISIEVPQAVQRAYGITLQDVADRIRRSAVELPGGGIKTTSGEILLRTMERRDYASQFRNIPILSRPDGTKVYLGDVAILRDGFGDTDEESYFDGKPAAMVDVYRVGDQTPIEISRLVHEYVEGLGASLPPGLSVTTWQDRARDLPGPHQPPPAQRQAGTRPRPRGPRPLPRDPPRLLGGPGNPRVHRGLPPAHAHPRRLLQHDQPLRIHPDPGHRGGTTPSWWARTSTSAARREWRLSRPPSKAPAPWRFPWSSPC